MSAPYTEQDLSDYFDAELVWRRKELSDLKTATKAADSTAKPALLRAVITLGYAHWEGYVRACANEFFEHLTLRRKRFSELERQLYVNSFLVRIDALHRSGSDLQSRCQLVNDILDGKENRFSYINPELVDTRSNLNTDAIRDICIICAVDGTHFEDKRTFIDTIMLKRRNKIAHGQQEFLDPTDLDEFIAEVLALMTHFRTLLENKAYLRTYLAA